MAGRALNPHWPRMYVVDAFTDLRPDLPPVTIDVLVDRAISELMEFDLGELPSEAFIP